MEKLSVIIKNSVLLFLFIFNFLQLNAQEKESEFTIKGYVKYLPSYLDYDAYSNFILTFTGNVTLANPTTESVWQSGIIVIIQDGTGSRTIATGTDYEWPASTATTISTSANAVDIIPYFIKAANSIQLGAAQLAFG